jgi:phospholipid/cholesterol/gamma-HCH transport system substrate-binding protein
MAENTTETIIGAAVLAAAAGFLIFASQATGIGPEGRNYELTASFRAADGVTVGTDVRLAGVKVGTVTALDLNPVTFRADARVSIREGIELPEDSAILVSQEGLLGGYYLEIQPGGSPFNIERGGEILDTQGSVSLVTLLMKFVSGGEGE